MKKFHLFIFLIFLLRLTGKAQDEINLRDRFYTRIGVGYGIGLCNYDPCDDYDEDYYPTYDDLRSINFVPGRGFDADVGAGYMFTRNIGAELDVNSFFGLPIKLTKNNYYSEGAGQTLTEQYSGTLLQLTPSFVLDLGLDKVDPYARFGLSIGVFPQILYKETDVSVTATTSYVGKYMGNVPLGYSAAAGVKYKLDNHFSLFGEFDCNGLNYSPTKYKLTKYTVNGMDELSTLSTRDKEIDFVKSYDASQTISSDSPNKQLRQSFPFSNFEINIGAQYRF
jgi:hypothetical protein